MTLHQWFVQERPPHLLRVLVSVELGDGTLELDQDAVTTLDGLLTVVVNKGIQILKSGVFHQKVAGAALDGLRAYSAVIDPVVRPAVRGELEGLKVEVTVLCALLMVLWLGLCTPREVHPWFSTLVHGLGWMGNTFDL